jgi:hypothetical protein
MVQNRNITAADAVVTLQCEELFPQGIILEQFSTDAMASMGDDTFAETRKGVDGQMVAGYVDGVKTVTVTLEASSPSMKYLDLLVRASRANKKVYWVTMLISMPALGKVVTFSNGVLKTGKLLPDIQQVLAPVAYTFDFERAE